jgi:hypothetical protein
VQDQSGAAYEVGPEHPDYARLRAHCAANPARNYTPARLFGILMIAAGFAGWWYNRHLAATQGQFYIKLCVFVPLAIFGGLLMAVRPDLAGPLRPGSTRPQKAALFTIIGLMAVLSGMEFFHLKQATTRKVVYTPWTPAMGTPYLPVSSAVTAGAAAPEIAFLGRRYHLASFNQQTNPQWEFVAPGETVNDWKTLITLIDRPDAHTKPELDRLAEGIMGTYKSHGAKILMAKTMQEPGGAPYNYMVAAFEEPATQRFELNFVKIALGSTNAEIMICGVRVGGTPDYATKARAFLDQHSSEIGRTLGETAMPDVSKLPRRPF